MNMIDSMRGWSRVVCIATIVALAGCQGIGGGPAAPRTAAEKEMDAQSDKYRNTVLGGALVGAGIGVAAGAVFALITGGDKKDVATAAAVGGLAGGAIGAADGHMTATRDQQQREQASRIQAAADQMRGDNAKLSQYIASSRRVLDEGKMRLASLQRDIAAGRTSADSARQAADRERYNIESMKKTMDEAKKVRDKYASAPRPANSAAAKDYDAEIKRMNEQISSLQSNINEYAEALRASKA